MIQAKHHIIIHPMFKWLTAFLLRRTFSSIHIDGNFKDNGKPILVIANHISWWDGFWMMHLNLKVLHRKFHFMMLEEQLKKHWYFQYTGAFSVKKKSQSIIESLHYTEKLLCKPDNMVFLFPQGKINSLYNNTIHFESGVQRIIEQAKDDLQVLFVANLLDYLSDSKPNLFMYIKGYLAKDLKGKLAENKYNNFYDKVLSQQKLKTS